MIAGRSDSGKPTGTFLYYSSESNIQLGLFCLTPQMLYKAVTLPALLSKDLDQSVEAVSSSYVIVVSCHK